MKEDDELCSLNIPIYIIWLYCSIKIPVNSLHGALSHIEIENGSLVALMYLSFSTPNSRISDLFHCC